MPQRKSLQTVTVILFLCLALTLEAYADAPAFSPLKQTSSGRSKPSGLDLMPQPADPSIPAGPLGRMVTRDLRTGEVTVRESVTVQEFLDSAIQPGGEGMSAGSVHGSDVGDKNFSDWVRVSYPAFGENPQHVKVWMEWDGDDSECSGTLIDPLHVITAGHCMYSHDPPLGWATLVQVEPGYELGSSPWGVATAIQMHSWTGWTQEEDSNHDMAVIDLDRPIGVFTGWRGFGYDNDCDWFDYGYWKHFSYPAEYTFDGEVMYQNWGDFDECSWLPGYNIIVWNMPSWGGSSGCGAIRDGAVFATAQGSDRVSRSTDVMITSGKFADIQGWIAADVPANPDLRPMSVQAEGEGFTGGEQLDALSFTLANYADLGLTTNVTCDIYFSEDGFITTDDVWFGNVSMPVDLPDMGAQSVDVIPPPIIPLATEGGRYYVGVILNHADANPLNNTTSLVELDSLFVDCWRPARPVILSPTEGETGVPVDITIDWEDQDDIQRYELQVGTLCRGGTIYDAGAGSQYTVMGLDHGTTYYAQVSALHFCGRWSHWSDCRTFTTVPVTGVEGVDGELTRFVLAGSHPNPFNPSTTIRFAVPEPAHVRVGVFDVLGRRVCTLRDGPLDGPGWHEVQWDGTDGAGQRVAAGVYFCRLDAANFGATSKMVLAK